MSDGERAKSRTHPFWGTSCVSCLDVHASALPGAVPLVGELRVPRYQGPLGCLLRRRQGGPWAPPPRDVQVPGDVHGSSCWIFCVGLGLVLCLFVLGYSSLGLVLVWSFSPSRLDPCRYFVWVLLSLFVWCVRRRRFSLFFFSLSLSLSLSGAGETQTPSGFGFPLVTLLRAHGLRPRPVLPLPLIHQGPAPAPVFFFVSPTFAWVVVGFLFSGWGLGSVCVLVGSGCLLAVLLRSCILSCLSGNSNAGIPAAMAPGPLPAADWIVPGYPSPAGSRPWDGPICGG